MKQITKTLLDSEEPSIHYKIKTHILEQNPDSQELIELQQKIKKSLRVKLSFLKEIKKVRFLFGLTKNGLVPIGF